jgi:hypothetical protein
MLIPARPDAPRKQVSLPQPERGLRRALNLRRQRVKACNGCSHPCFALRAMSGRHLYH